MKRFLDLLRTPKPASADLRTALAQIDVPAAQAEHDRLKAERAALLMEGDDKTLDALEAKISAAARQIERAEILRGQLEAGIQEAEAREAQEALSAERAAAEAEAVAVAKALRTQYPKIATELVALLDRLEAAEKAVKVVNRKLHEAHRSDETLKVVETRVFPVGQHEYEPAKSLLNRTVLIEKPGICPGYNTPVDTGGWIIQNPTAPAIEPQRPAMVSQATIGGFVDVAGA